jgi:mRNA interferase HigB
MVAVRVIAVSLLRAFWEKHTEAEQPLRAWVKAVGAVRWKRPSDIAAQFTTPSVLKSRRVVFNIKGNDYRLIAVVSYRFGAVYVKFIGTHGEYDRIDADTVEMP